MFDARSFNQSFVMGSTKVSPNSSRVRGVSEAVRVAAAENEISIDIGQQKEDGIRSESLAVFNSAPKDSPSVANKGLRSAATIPVKTEAINVSQWGFATSNQQVAAPSLLTSGGMYRNLTRITPERSAPDGSNRDVFVEEPKKCPDGTTSRSIAAVKQLASPLALVRKNVTVMPQPASNTVVQLGGVQSDTVISSKAAVPVKSSSGGKTDGSERSKASLKTSGGLYRNLAISSDKTQSKISPAVGVSPSTLTHKSVIVTPPTVDVNKTPVERTGDMISSGNNKRNNKVDHSHDALRIQSDFRSSQAALEHELRAKREAMASSLQSRLKSRGADATQEQQPLAATKHLPTSMRGVNLSPQSGEKESVSAHQHLRRAAELRSEYQVNTQKDCEQRDVMRTQLQQKVAERLAVRKDRSGRD
jgi:hypothetical protein